MKSYLQVQTNTMGADYYRNYKVRSIKIKEMFKFKFHEHEVIHESMQL
ncbi:MAG: hypothetical protein GY714_30110 [Desulfobacterales bacterium]|nr:hypothetical protein [Desulfobacterales bacterium]